MSYLTYAEKIRALIKDINDVYEAAEGLRDMATGDEKKHWNKLRGNLYDADKPLRELYSNLGTVGYHMPDAKTWFKKSE